MNLSRTCGARLILLGWLLAPALGAQQPAPCGMDSLAPWAMVNRAWANERSQAWTNDSLRRVLLDMVRQDQAMRVDFGAQMGDTAYIRQLMALDKRLSDQLAGILDRFGLPTRAMVGARGVDAAFLLTQHSAYLQPRMLALGKAAAPGQVSRESMAMLEDRVLNSQGKPQRFGTYTSIGSDGLLRFVAVADPAGLERRRAAAGLMPIAQYVCFIEQSGMRVDRESIPRPGPR